MHPAAMIRDVSGSFVWRCIMRLFTYATPMQAPLLWGILLTADCEWLLWGIMPQWVMGLGASAVTFFRLNTKLWAEVTPCIDCAGMCISCDL